VRFDSYYTAADVCKEVGWDGKVNTLYQRVHAAVSTGHAGDVARCGRSFVLSADNVRRLPDHLRGRWPEGEKRRRGAKKTAAG
jgi:hypothetical protein